MPRLIDADALDDVLDEFEGLRAHAAFTDGIMVARRELALAPTIDAEPVRHGRWEEPYPLYICDCYKCSCCSDMYERTWNYCPNCGAKMDLEVQDG